MSVPSGVTVACEGMAAEARIEARKHLKMAIDYMNHGEDDQAEAHVLDAIRHMGRAQAFVQAAEVIMDKDDE